MLLQSLLVERLGEGLTFGGAAALHVLHVQRGQIAAALVVQHLGNVQRSVGEGIVVFHAAVVRAPPQQERDSAGDHGDNQRLKAKRHAALGVHADDRGQIHQRGQSEENNQNPHGKIQRRIRALPAPSGYLLQKVVHDDTSV